MTKDIINHNFLKLQNNYLFAEINRKVNEYLTAHPEAQLIQMGIGDVTLPLPPTVIKAMHEAVDELASKETLKGYGPEQGYAFLREVIAEHDFHKQGMAHISADDIFVGDGAKSDTANITDLLGAEVRIAVTDPVYPVYVDSNVISGRTGEFVDGKWNRVEYLPMNRENRFVPPLPTAEVDVLYLCSPNNPTGATLTRSELKAYVDFALQHGVLIFFDAAYEAFIRDEEVPHSIYEIEGAERCAVEFRSFSKTAGFTGVRAGYTVVPNALKAKLQDGKEVALNPLWRRRQTTKFNGASYISQRAAAAIYTPEGQKEIKANIDYYLENARIIYTTLEKAGYEVFGGTNSPYIWVKTPPEHASSWDFFQYLLEEKQIVGTPGAGFGPEGEGYFRLSAFNSREATIEAMARLA